MWYLAKLAKHFIRSIIKDFIITLLYSKNTDQSAATRVVTKRIGRFCSFFATPRLSTFRKCESSTTETLRPYIATKCLRRPRHLVQLSLWGLNWCCAPCVTPLRSTVRWTKKYHLYLKCRSFTFQTSNKTS